jgi:uroporphyrinogen-III decarboxylase
MNSLERVMAAVNGEPFDKYPFVNPYPTWSMMPHWPDLVGLTHLHVGLGSDEERLRCCAALNEIIGLDWITLLAGPAGQDARFKIEDEDGVPVVVDLWKGTRTRHEEFPIDSPVAKPKFTSAAEVESLAPPPTAEEMLADATFDFTRKQVERFGDSVFILDMNTAPYARCYYALGFNVLFDALVANHSLLYALLEWNTEMLVERAKALGRLGVHGMRMHDFFCSAEMISEKDYLAFAFPYELRVVRAIREAGMVAILEPLGWIEPRLPHFARLGLNCIEAESSLKGYRNDVAVIRQVLGEEVCILGNTPIHHVIEEGTEEVWRQDAIEQARGIGEQRRYAICAGSPTTWATTPTRLRRYGEFTRGVLGELAPPLGAA